MLHKIEGQNINLKRAYSQIKKRCGFQKKFSMFLLCGFFVLQYSVPIFLVVLGSVSTSREQLSSFVQKLEPPSENENNEDALQKTQLEAELLISKIIFILGLLTILLGVINNIMRPSESYDKAAEFNNRFYKFDIELELEIMKIGGMPQTSDTTDFSSMINLLTEKNQELSRLIDEYNRARSLQPRIAEIESLKQEIDEIKNTTNIKK